MFKERYKSHHSSNPMLEKAIPKEKSTKELFLEELSKEVSEESKVLYIHVPFCDKICSFCNLNRKQQDNDLEDYTNFLLRELEFYSRTNYVQKSVFEAIYFGGGTPTIFKENQLRKILYFIKDNFHLHKEYEWTLETTLHNLNDEKIRLFNEVGVNRLSVGIQTFSDKGRKFLNRTFDKATVVEKVKNLRQNFNGFVCADIIYNYEGESLEEVVEDARLVKDLGFDSASFYSLMIHQGSKLSESVEEDKSLEKDLELYRAFYEEIEKSSDWELMELTKFVRKERDKYKYIGLRNNGHDTLAIGVGAGGNTAGFVSFSMNERMSMHMKEEKIHTKYRKLSGLFQFKDYDFEKVKKYLDKEEYTEFLQILKEFEKEGFGKLDDIKFSLNSLGVFWGNNMSKYINDRLIERELKYV